MDLLIQLTLTLSKPITPWESRLSSYLAPQWWNNLPSSVSTYLISSHLISSHLLPSHLISSLHSFSPVCVSPPPP